jgi:hypothetical protein
MQQGIVIQINQFLWIPDVLSGKTRQEITEPLGLAII